MNRIVVGVLAHVDSGKTTLSEAMMYRCGSINKLGRVDHGDSHLDTFSLERSRGITIFSKQAVLSYKDTEFTLLDTPGHVDFSAETERTLQVLDYAVLVISAGDGIQSHTQTLWQLLAKYKVPCFIFINKMDLDGADKKAILSRIKSELSDRCIDFENTDSPEFYENAAMCDESLLESYYSNDKIGIDELTAAIKTRKVFPCMFGSALKLSGVDEFLNCLYKYTRMPDYGDEFSGRVYKISNEKGQKLTHLKVTGGTLKVRDILQSDKNKNAEKVNQIRIYTADKFHTVNEAPAGTICAVTGINFAASGDGLGSCRDTVLPVLEPLFTYSITLDDKTDPHTVYEKMKILESEDSLLKVSWNSRLAEIQLQIMGDIQLEVLRCVLKDRFGINASFSDGKIIYKETIENTVEGVGHFEPLRHYAEVHLILKPGERNSGLVFDTDCREDTLDKNWQRLILTHLYEKTHIGVLTGSPITDMKITLVSGKAHPKHTEGGDFRQATYRAVRQGLRSAKSVLLEPMYEFRLDLPTENIGKAMADIQRMHGRFNRPLTDSNHSVLTGEVPVSEMRDYARDVTRYTKGQGKLNCSFSGYQPCHNADEVIKQIGYDCDSDTDNPCDSVFCAHGAGYTVKWDEVPSHMHLPSALSSRKKSRLSDIIAPKKDYFAQKNKVDLFALDKELMQIFEQTYGPVKPKKNSAVKEHFTFTKKDDDKKSKTIKKTAYEQTEYLLVDGYNVIFSWDELKNIADDNIDTARRMLINILCNYQGYKKCEVILVFDAYKVKGNVREVEKENNITIVYTKEAETADMYIEKASYKLAKNNKVRVVTSDALEQMIILAGGALRVSSKEFLQEVRDAEENIRNIIAKEY